MNYLDMTVKELADIQPHGGKDARPSLRLLSPSRKGWPLCFICAQFAGVLAQPFIRDNPQYSGWKIVGCHRLNGPVPYPLAFGDFYFVKREVLDLCQFELHENLSEAGFAPRLSNHSIAIKEPGIPCHWRDSGTQRTHRRFDNAGDLELKHIQSMLKTWTLGDSPAD